MWKDFLNFGLSQWNRKKTPTFAGGRRGKEIRTCLRYGVGVGKKKWKGGSRPGGGRGRRGRKNRKFPERSKNNNEKLMVDF